MSLPGSSTMAAEDQEKADSAAESGRLLLELIRRDLKPRDILTRKAFENAIAVVMAIGGSTNAVLHLLAIAHAAEVDLAIDDFQTIRDRTPVLANMKPSGQYVVADLHQVGGIPVVMKMLLGAGLLHGDCITVTGRTVAENLAQTPDRPPPDQDVLLPMDRPVYAQGHIVVLRGNLAAEGCVAKISGIKGRCGHVASG